MEIKDARNQAGTDNDLALATKGEPPVTKEGRKALALRRWTQLNPDRLKYELIYADKSLAQDAPNGSLQFARSPV